MDLDFLSRHLDNTETGYINVLTVHTHREIQRVRVGSVYEWEEGGEGVRQEEMGGGIFGAEEDITRIAGRRISGAV